MWICVVVEADDVRITVIGTDSKEENKMNEKKWKEHDNDQHVFGDVQFHTTHVKCDSSQGRSNLRSQAELAPASNGTMPGLYNQLSQLA